MLKRIYVLLPTWLQNLMCSVKGWLVCRRRYGRQFHRELEKYMRGSYKQDELLFNFLWKLRKHPVYKTYLKGEDWERLKSEKSRVYTIIQKFPIIDKVTVKESMHDYAATSYQGAKMIMRTSGTTGGGLVFPYSVVMENKQWAVWWRYRIRLGIDFNTWCGWFGGMMIISPKSRCLPYWRINRPGKQVMFSSYHLSERTVQSYYEEIQKRKLQWLHGYPSHIAKFAALFLDAGLPPLLDVRFVTTGAENVLGNQVELFLKAFPNAMVRQHYGQNEGVATISQDRAGEWHVDDDFAYVEFVPVSQDNINICRIVGTSFSNDAFPLVRYDTGDLATVEYDEQGKLSRIVSIDGRSSNALKQPSGGEISEGALSVLLHDFQNVTEAQFHQKSLFDIELWIVRGKEFSADDEQAITLRMAENLEAGVHISIKFVDSVERTKAGKLKLVISEMGQTDL